VVAEIIQDECAAVIQSTRDRAKRPALANTYGFHKMQEICRAAEQQSDSQLSHYVELGIMIVDTIIGNTAKKFVLCLHTVCPFYRVPQPWHFQRMQHLHPPGHAVTVAVLGDTQNEHLYL